MQKEVTEIEGKVPEFFVDLQTKYVKAKVKLSLCLTKHHTMKTYWGVEV
jgi:hypothetical protein